jgi:2-amino-4-hydroxy-6-hydroxymethyldihydropteridine diphosphokinase
MNQTFLLLGTNQGNRALNLAEAKSKISRELGTIITTSSIYKTAAWGLENQPEFYNEVIIVETGKDAFETLSLVLNIEHQLGRVRSEKWGPRIIDIDILFFNDSIIDSPTLKIPHPEIQHRMFTLKPLVEVAQNFIHPTLHKSLQQVMEECLDTLPVNKIEL